MKAQPGVIAGIQQELANIFSQLDEAPEGTRFKSTMWITKTTSIIETAQKLEKEAREKFCLPPDKKGHVYVKPGKAKDYEKAIKEAWNTDVEIPALPLTTAQLETILDKVKVVPVNLMSVLGEESETAE